MTLRCCGLIMQDAYGLFLEADRADRMEVIGNLMGLGVYDQLEKMAKEKATETNRELTKSKDKLAELGERLKAKPGLKAELAEVENEITELATEIEAKDALLREFEELARSLEAKAQKVAELQQQAKTVKDEITLLGGDKLTHEQRLSKAHEVLACEEKILTKAVEYENAREKVAVLQAKQPRLKELSDEEKRTASDMHYVQGQIKRADGQVGDLENLLANRDKLNLAAVRYREDLCDLKNIKDLAKQHIAFHDQIMTLEKSLDKSYDAADNIKNG